MANLLERFVHRTEFDSYEDFYKNFSISVPENFNFAYDVVDVYATEQPEKRALIWVDDHGHERTLTFGDLKYLSDKAANFFLSQGIRKGDHVMLILRGHYSFWYCLLGLHKIGAITTPATHMLTSKDLVYRIDKGDIRMIVASNWAQLPDHVEDAEGKVEVEKPLKVLQNGTRPGWLSLEEEMEKISPDFTRPVGEANTRSEDISLALFSSGTSSYPKMVQHDFLYPLAHIVTAKYWQRCIDDGLHYTVADTGWGKVLWGKIYGQWICGSAVFVYDYDKFSAPSMAAMCARYGVTTFCAPPTVYRFLIKKDLAQYDFSMLQNCTVAGESLDPEVYNRFKQFTGLGLREGFGQTETALQLFNPLWITPRPGSTGQPSPLYDVKLLNAQGQICEDGEEGEIVIAVGEHKPLGLFAGFYKGASLAEVAAEDGFYHTGDIAWRDEDGYYWFVGRADDIIKSSGYRIGPFEVESALIEHPAVLECAITGVPDPDRGQIVKATIVLTSGYTPSESLKKELQNHVKNVTAPYKYPRAIEFVEELPKTISGKIRRVEIRERDREGK